MTAPRVASSFRDPSGFLYTRDGTLLRQVQPAYRAHYEHLKASGLYDALVRDRLLVAHEEVPLDLAATAGAAFVLRPERIPFVAFPYEWGFGQLRAAALLTLRVQAVALQHGMILKDASAYNVQFVGARPLFVDTLSFETRVEGDPWVAYRQFCQHFLAPLALAARVDVRLRDLLRQHLDGVPLDLASALLPRATWLAPWAMMHIHLHARAIARHASTRGADRSARASAAARVSRTGLEGLVAHLRGAVEGLRLATTGTEWGDYEATHGYGAAEHEAKRALVARQLAAVRPALVFDLGANTGEYSRLAREAGARVVSLDGDPVAVERNYERLAAEGDDRILPLWMDLTNPSPSQGWAHREWPSFEARGPADVVMALALIHHLAIGNNVPLPDVAAYLARLGRHAILEWVPKPDPQVQRLLASRRDIFDGYTEDGLLAAIAPHFTVLERAPIPGSGRVLFLLKRIAA